VIRERIRNEDENSGKLQGKKRTHKSLKQ
jgi:hypothetical protein